MLLKAAHAVARAGVLFGGVLILLSALLIGIDVVLRRLFATSIGGADELAGYALAIGSTWALAATLLERGHIRIDSLYGLLPAAVRVLLDFIGLGLMVAFFALVGWHGIGVVEQSWTAGSRSQSALEVPVIVPQLIWILGLGMFVLVGVLLVLAALAKLLAGDRGAVAQLIGTRSSEEDVAEEMRAAAARRAAEGA